MRTLLYRSGFAMPVLGRSLWVVAASGADIDAAYASLDAALERRPGHLMVLCVPAGADLGRLVRRYEREVVLPLPHASAAARFVRQINPSLAVLLGPDNDWRRSWQKRIAALGLAVETLAPGDSGTAERLA